MKILTHILTENAKLPKRAHYNDSGADVFSSEDVILKSKQMTVVPLGISIEIPDGYDGVIHCKSGLSSKGILSSNAPIDSGYRGEIHAILYNTTETNYVINQGDKVGQLVIRPVIYSDYVTDLGEERNSGAFGSTGK